MQPLEEQNAMQDQIPTTIPPFEYNRINARILAGRNPLTVEDMECLHKEGVTHVLDLRESHEWMPPRMGEAAVAYQMQNGLRRCHLPIVDVSAPQPQAFETAVAFLEEALSEPDTQVYVHCRAGMERTAAVLMAYFAICEGTSCHIALQGLQRSRAKFQPLRHQVQAVETWLRERQSSPKDAGGF